MSYSHSELVQALEKGSKDPTYVHEIFFWLAAHNPEAFMKAVTGDAKEWPTNLCNDTASALRDVPHLSMVEYRKLVAAYNNNGGPVNRVEAIRALRQLRTDIRLKEAKDTIEAWFPYMGSI